MEQALQTSAAMRSGAGATAAARPTAGVPAAAGRIGAGFGDATGRLFYAAGVPVAAFALFLFAWSFAAARIDTSLGAMPGPVAVGEQAVTLVKDHFAERQKRAEFYERQDKRNAERKAEDPNFKPRAFQWTGKPTYFDQIVTSLLTVFTGFLIATVIAVPLGILAGSSKVVQAAINPMVQLFRPVSPLAWLPIVTLLVSALYVTSDPMFQKSFLISAITVTLCSLWTTLINTAIGVTSVDKDLVNVGKVLQLPLMTRVRKIILPSALPYIFTGMRLVAGRRLDGADRRRNAGPEPGPRQVRVGRIPERQLELAGAHPGGGVHHRNHRFRARPDHADAAEPGRQTLKPGDGARAWNWR